MKFQRAKVEVAAEVREAILDHFSRRTQRRLGLATSSGAIDHTWKPVE